MDKLFVFTTFLVLALSGYWYAKPHHAPVIIRGNLPALELRSLRLPTTGFRAFHLLP